MRSSKRLAALVLAAVFALILALPSTLAARTDVSRSAAGYGAISGVVSAYGSSAKIAEVAVQFDKWDSSSGWSNQGSVMTDNNGAYTSMDLEPGRYRVVFSKYGLQTQWWNGSLTAEGATDVNVAADQTVPNVNASLRSAWGTIRGKVTRETDNRNMADVNVWFHQQQGGGGWSNVGGATTAADGTYTSPDLEPGTYRVEFTETAVGSKTYARQYWDGRLVATLATPVIVEAGEAETGINAAMFEIGTKLTLTATPALVTDGGSSVITAKLTRLAGRALEGYTLGCEKLGAGGWEPAADAAITNASGIATFSVTPSPWSTKYRVTFEETDGWPASTKEITIQTLDVLAISAPSSVKKNSSFKVTGTIAPAHAAGTAKIKVRTYRKSGKKWVAGKSYTAKLNYSDAENTTWSATVKLPAKGTWRLVALNGCSGHAAASISRQVTAK